MASAGRELFERHQHVADDVLNRDGDEGVAIPPVVVVHALIASLERVDGQVEENGRAQGVKRPAPDLDAFRLLDQEMNLEPLVTHGQQVAVVAEIEELFTLARSFASEVLRLVVAVEVDLVSSAASLVAFEKLLFDVRFPRGGQGGQPVLAREDVCEHGGGLHDARPADERGHAPAAIPAGILLTPKGRGAGIREQANHRTIVGQVQNDCALGQTQAVHLVQQLPDESVMLDHAVAGVGLRSARPRVGRPRWFKGPPGRG
jgi:hypothetical protein